MSNLDIAAKLLEQQDTVTFRPRGNSMAPRVLSGRLVTVKRIEDHGSIRTGDIVLCKVHGIMRLHLVTAIDREKRRAQIGNNHGLVNGWTSFDRVYGIMI